MRRKFIYPSLLIALIEKPQITVKLITVKFFLKISVTQYIKRPLWQKLEVPSFVELFGVRIACVLTNARTQIRTRVCGYNSQGNVLHPVT